MRHCAFCLTELLNENTIKICSGCGRRAYCGDKCLTADASKTFSANPTGFGQGHADWCGVPYGEEDIDWKVIPVEGKGLGVVALKEFAATSRVMVDAVQAFPLKRKDPFHPGILDLVGRSLKEKFELNSGECRDADEIASTEARKVALRFSRINHNCDSNAAFVHDVDTMVVFAKRDIKPGEEICIAYASIRNLGLEMPYLPGVGFLLPTISFEKWGFSCPSSCICKDERKTKEALVYHRMELTIDKYKSQGKVDEALHVVRHLVGKLEGAGFSQLAKCRIAYQGFKLGIRKRSTLDEALDYIKLVKGIEESIYHPKSEELAVTLKFVEKPSLSKKYLCLEVEKGSVNK